MPRLTAALVAAAALLLMASPRADELGEAGKLLRAGQPERALERVDAVLAGNPADPRARFLQGLIYAEQGKTDAAIEVFQKLTVDYPELPEPHNNLAVIYASQGQYDKARVALEQSIRTHPSYATAYENLGDVYAKLASQAYDRALELDSSNTGAQNKLALVRDLVSGTPVKAASTPAAQAKAVPEAAAPAPRAAPAPKPSAPAAQVAVAVPAPAPAAEASDVLEAVEAWAQAWSRQDVDAYLAAYAPDFRTPGGEPRDAWEQQRKARVSGPKSISVEIDKPRVRSTGDDLARVTFRQHYRSERFKASSTKTLTLQRSGDGRWRILEERIGG